MLKELKKLNVMDDKSKKQYVVNSLKFDSGSRISEVVNRYFKSVYSAKNLKKSGDKIIEKKETKSSIIEFAEKLFK